MIDISVIKERKPLVEISHWMFMHYGFAGVYDIADYACLDEESLKNNPDMYIQSVVKMPCLVELCYRLLSEDRLDIPNIIIDGVRKMHIGSLTILESRTPIESIIYNVLRGKEYGSELLFLPLSELDAISDSCRIYCESINFFNNKPLSASLALYKEVNIYRDIKMLLEDMGYDELPISKPMFPDMLTNSIAIIISKYYAGIDPTLMMRIISMIGGLV